MTRARVFGTAARVAALVLLLVAWGLAFALSMVAVVASWRQHGVVALKLWGAWLCLGVATAVLAGEIVGARLRRGREAKPAQVGQSVREGT